MRFIQATILTLLIGISSANAQYDIRFKVNGLSAGDECILAHYYADKNKVIDTAAVDNQGYVKYQGEGKLLNGVYILVLPQKSYLELIVPNDDQDFTIEFDTTLSPLKKSSTGSLDNQLFIEFDKFSVAPGSKKRALIKDYRACVDDSCKQRIKEEVEALDNEIDVKRKEIIANYPNTFTAKLFKPILEIEIPEDLKGDKTGKAYAYYKKHFWDSFDLSDDGLLRTPIFQGKLEYYITKVVLQDPDTLILAIDDLLSRIEAGGAMDMFKYVVWWNTNHHEESERICMDKVLYHIAKNYYLKGKCEWADSTTIANMTDYIKKAKNIQCGSIAPNMKLVDTTYLRSVELYKIKYPVTIVVFWSHTCGHCKEEIPKLKQMYDSLHDKGVEIYAVYTGSDVTGWKKYIRENKLTWLNLVDAHNNSTYKKDYNQVKTPEVFLLDQHKTIKYKNPPAENVGKIVEMMLEEHNKETADTPK
ncbi:MAG: thiol-disulfide isomerase/thioredoxin [Bacteroidia bacterium]|jgi:thiol-disulfide isomerase/thioredoxin